MGTGDQLLLRLSRWLVVAGLVLYLVSALIVVSRTGVIVGWSLALVGAVLHLGRYWRDRGKIIGYWRSL